MVQMANVNMSSPISSPYQSHQHMQRIVVPHLDVPFWSAASLPLVLPLPLPFTFPFTRSFPCPWGHFRMSSCVESCSLAPDVFTCSFLCIFAEPSHYLTTLPNCIRDGIGCVTSLLVQHQMLSHVHRCYLVRTDASSDLIWDSLSSICSILVRDRFSNGANSVLDHST